MTQTILPVPADMTAAEARRLVDRIRRHMDDARLAVYELHERRGWEALGYSSWRECVLSEFNQSQAQLYRLLQAARTEREVAPAKRIGTHSEYSLSALYGLPPETKAWAWQMACEIAGCDRPTRAQVEEAVEKIRLRKMFDQLPATQQVEIIQAEEERLRQRQSDRESRDRERKQIKSRMRLVRDGCRHLRIAAARFARLGEDGKAVTAAVKAVLAGPAKELRDAVLPARKAAG